jgi:hypothetical protein
LLCVGGIISLPWIKTATRLIEEQLASWRHPYTYRSRINIRWVGVSVSNSAGA